MLALVALTVLFTTALYALGQVRGTAAVPAPAAVGPSIRRGARALAHVGDAWRPIEHLRG